MKTAQPAGWSPGQFLFEETIPGGGLWSGVVRRHWTLRLTALAAGANVGLMAYRDEDRLNRLNLPDTLKAQHTAKLTRGHVLLSDMGHTLFSITGDSCGWHDPLGGHSDARDVVARYGEATYQQKRNDWYRNAQDNFLIELTKHGLGRRDMVANVNLFSRLNVDVAGKMHFQTGHAQAGHWVDLRAEMNVLVVLNTCQHPLDTTSGYGPKPVQLTFFRSDPPTADDYCRKYRPENERSMTLTERLFL